MITSLVNKTIKEAIDLKKSGKRKKSGLTLIDGFREIELALRAKIEIVSLFYCSNLISNGKTFFGFISPEKMIEVSEPVFRKICYKENPDGFLVIARTKEKKLEDLKIGKNTLLLVLESVEKPGNLGGIIRTARASGVEAVIINGAQTDIYNPNVIRASEGYVFEEKVIISSVGETAEWLKKNKVKSFAAAATGNKIYTSVNFCEPTAIVLGSEAEGLSEEWLKQAEQLIKIPMKDGVDSLNVSVAAAIISYEVLRQRTIK